MPKVSIIIPTYNVEQYLHECMESVVNQTLKDIEIICIDDGSTDNSGKILDEYASKDDRIKVIHKANSGYGNSMNIGLDNATGEYIGIVEPDDYIELDMYEILYNKAVANDVDFVKSNFFAYCTNNIVKNVVREIFEKEDIYNEIITPLKYEKCFIGTAAIWTALYKADFLKRNNIRFLETAGASFQDTGFNIRVLFEAEKAIYIPDALYHYRTDNQNSSVKSNSKIFYIKQELDNLYEMYSLDPYKKKILNSLYIDKYSWNFNRLNKEGRKQFKKEILNLKDIIYERQYSGIIADENMVNTCKSVIDYENNLLGKIFSIRNNYKKTENKYYKVIRIFGLSFKLRYLTKEFKTLRTQVEDLQSKNADNCKQTKILAALLNREVPNKKRVLIIEPNDFHSEVVPGFVKYFTDLGYECDIILTFENFKQNAICRLGLKNVNVYTFNCEFVNLLFSTNIIKRYDKILFTTFDTYNNDFPTILETFPKVKEYMDKLYVVEHRLESVNEDLLNAKKVIMLAKLPNTDNRIIVANPHYFGNVSITPKNTDKVNFIMVGAIEKERRNCSLLIDAVKKLHKKNINNFRITVIGDGSLKGIDKRIRKYFNILGRVPYDVMYSEMEKADFFLPLLDPENPIHDRYITTGTSGSFQLIYGFRKPCLIAEKFAKYHLYDNENSIIYRDNIELAEAMIKAVSMDSDEYKQMQEKLANTANSLYVSSLNNLSDNIVEDNHEYCQ